MSENNDTNSLALPGPASPGDSRRYRVRSTWSFRQCAGAVVPANGDIFTELATVREIAAALSVTENAIKLHQANLVAKFGIDGVERRRSRLANAALDAGVVTLANLRAP
jgi:hypothetical protein